MSTGSNKTRNEPVVLLVSKFCKDNAIGNMFVDKYYRNCSKTVHDVHENTKYDIHLRILESFKFGSDDLS